MRFLTSTEILKVGAAVIQSETRVVAVARQRRRVHAVVAQHVLHHAARVSMAAAKTRRGAQVGVGHVAVGKAAHHGEQEKQGEHGVRPTTGTLLR